MSRYYLGTAKTWPFNLLYLARVLASKLEITGPNQIFPRTHDGIFLGQKRLKGNRVKKEWGKRGCDAKISSKKGWAKDQALQALKILSNSLWSFPIESEEGTDGSTTSAKCSSAQNCLFPSFNVSTAIDNSKVSVLFHSGSEKSNEDKEGQSASFSAICLCQKHGIGIVFLSGVWGSMTGVLGAIRQGL